MKILIPLVAIAIGLFFALAILLNRGAPPPDQRRSDQTAEPVNSPEIEDISLPIDTEPTGLTQTDPAPEPASADKPSTNQVEELSAAFETVPLDPLRVRPATQAGSATLGSNATKNPFKLKVDISYYGPGIKRISLTDYMIKSGDDENYVIHQTAQAGRNIIHPFQALAITINGQRIKLDTQKWNLIREEEHGQTVSGAIYQLSIVDESDNPVLDITRTFRVEPGNFDLRIFQSFENQYDRPLSIVWEQCAQADATEDGAGYRGDDRKYMIGYFNPSRDPERKYIYSDDTYLSRKDVLQSWVPTDGSPPKSIWPRSDVEGGEMVWVASLNRYFAVTSYLIPSGPDADGKYQGYPFGEMFDLGIMTIGEKGSDKLYDLRKAILTLKSKPVQIQPDQAKNLDLGLFLGPRDDKVLKSEPYKSLWFQRTIIYTMGCTWCTFQPLAKLLLWILEGLHAMTRDWGIAIILLVCFVRLLLHPITKKSQVNMMKMGKQMQALQPEIEKLKKKYGENKKKIGDEQMKLFREKGINPVNILGCLPMFLQMPIWIALYAMLYFAVELRHEHAFYGFFQLISGGAWSFLKDLSAPDRFILFFDEPRLFKLFLFYFDYSSINVLPLLMAVVFYIQQKMTMTPAATEEQRRQQKMMSYMVFLFPFFMYSMPSGLTLYIMASTGIGILESYLVRKHIREQEESGELFKKEGPKPGSFRDRLHKVLESKQQDLLAMRKGGRGGKRLRPKR